MSIGGPAFPVPDVLVDGQVRPSDNAGMSLRDYFATAAMQALLTTGKYQAFTAELGETAYAAADNMIKARA